MCLRLYRTLKVFGFFFSLIFYCVSHVFAQDLPHPPLKRVKQKQLLKTNPLPVLWGNIPLTAEYRLLFETPSSPDQSLMLGVSYLGKGPFLVALVDTTQNPSSNLHKFAEDLKVSGFRMQGMYRFYLYPKNHSPDGFYIGPHASYTFAKFYLPVQKQQYLAFVYYNVNVLAGVQAFVSDIFCFDFFFGLGYRNNLVIEHNLNNSSASSAAPDPFEKSMPKHLKITLGLNFGFAF